jgi:hypothetical protein
MRVIVRRERPHPDAQRRLTDPTGTASGVGCVGAGRTLCGGS